MMRTPVIVSNNNNHPKPPDQGGGNDAVVQGVVEEAEAAGINDELPDIPLYRPTDNMRGDQEENNIRTEASTVPSQMVGLLCPNCGILFKSVDAIKEHLHVCKGKTTYNPKETPVQQSSSSSAQMRDPGTEEAQECHICDKSFKSHRILDNHMKKQHGLAASSKTVNNKKVRGPKKQKEDWINDESQSVQDTTSEANILPPVGGQMEDNDASDDTDDEAGPKKKKRKTSSKKRLKEEIADRKVYKQGELNYPFYSACFALAGLSQLPDVHLS